MYILIKYTYIDNVYKYKPFWILPYLYSITSTNILEKYINCFLYTIVFLHYIYIYIHTPYVFKLFSKKLRTYCVYSREIRLRKIKYIKTLVFILVYFWDESLFPLPPTHARGVTMDIVDKRHKDNIDDIKKINYEKNFFCLLMTFFFFLLIFEIN